VQLEQLNCSYLMTKSDAEVDNAVRKQAESFTTMQQISDYAAETGVLYSDEYWTCYGQAF